MVFTTQEDKSLHPGSLARCLNRLIAGANAPEISFHDLRDTAATLMLANNAHPRIVRERLGHSDISMTMNLDRHVTMDTQQEVAEQLDTLLDGTS